jgi:hypothetical protein
LQLSGINNASSRTLTAREGGSTVGTFTILGTEAGWTANTNYTIENVVAWINGLSGWTATGNDVVHPRRANLLGLVGSKGTAFGQTDCGSADLQLITTADIHSDLLAYNQPNENIIHHDVRAYEMQSQLLFMTHPSGLNDVTLVNIAAANQVTLPTGYTDYISQFARAQSHVVVAHCSLPNQGIWLRVTGSLYNPDTYSAFINTAAHNIEWSGTPDADLTIANCAIDAGETAPSGATGTIIGGDGTSKFEGFEAGDFTPAGVLLADPKAPVVAKDLNRVTRPSLAPVGALT